MINNKNEQKREFVQLLQSTGRQGVDDVIEDLERKGFFEAPASSVHHLNTEGGLVVHSLNTYRCAKMIFEGMKALEPWIEKEVGMDSIIIASLLHDVCKSDIYRRSVKKVKSRFDGWEDAEGYKVSYKSFPMGHGEKSLVMLLCSGLELTDAEMLAIRWHMGGWGVNMHRNEEVRNFDSAIMQYPLVSIIQAADLLAASIVEHNDALIDEL